MKVDFDLLPDYSRIWIYQSDRPFTPLERDQIMEMSEQFITEWTAHGNVLKAGAKIFFDHFLVLAVNEHANSVSGCSIDSSVRFIRRIEDRFHVSLTDRSLIACRKDGKIMLTDLKGVKNEIANHHITEDTLIFNNLVQAKGDLTEQWLIPAGKSWMKKYFKLNRGDIA